MRWGFMHSALNAEVTLMLANRSNRITLITLTLLLLVSAIWSGVSARELRAQHAATAAAAREIVEQTRSAIAEQGTRSPRDAASQAYAFGRSDAAPALLPGGGGMALSVSRFERLSPETRVSVDSRLADGRRGEGLDNPLLPGLGRLDLATTTAIFVPLAALLLCTGLIQRERTLGIWRALRVQMAGHALRLITLRLFVRATALAFVVAIASLPAFVIDTGATVATACHWFALAAGYVVVWVGVAGTLCLLRVETAAALTAGLALWVITLFVMPALLHALAEHHHPAGSRLENIVELRATQLRVENREHALLAAWYEAHVEWSPPADMSHTWPVTFLPRHAALDAHMRPLLRHHDSQRAARFMWLERHAWMAPPLALVMAADQLAGIDAPRYASFVHAADRYEDDWRALIVPRVMSYQGLTTEMFDRLPTFEPPAQALPGRSVWWGFVAIFTIAAMILLLGQARLAKAD